MWATADGNNVSVLAQLDAYAAHVIEPSEEVHTAVCSAPYDERVGYRSDCCYVACWPHLWKRLRERCDLASRGPRDDDRITVVVQGTTSMLVPYFHAIVSATLACTLDVHPVRLGGVGLRGGAAGGSAVAQELKRAGCAVVVRLAALAPSHLRGCAIACLSRTRILIIPHTCSYCVALARALRPTLDHRHSAVRNGAVARSSP